MRYAILSDIHANCTALKRVLKDVRAQGADKIVCLGDVVGYGPDAEDTVALVRNTVDVCLMGNHDAAVAAVISYTPELTAEQAELRVYKTYCTR